MIIRRRNSTGPCGSSPRAAVHPGRLRPARRLRCRAPAARGQHCRHRRQPRPRRRRSHQRHPAQARRDAGLHRGASRHGGAGRQRGPRLHDRAHRAGGGAAGQGLRPDRPARSGPRGAGTARGRIVAGPGRRRTAGAHPGRTRAQPQPLPHHARGAPFRGPGAARGGQRRARPGDADVQLPRLRPHGRRPREDEPRDLPGPQAGRRRT